MKSLLGISIPTTLRPGMGASMRSVRAASAMARSSASPSMRETLTSGAGYSSYWVTTGPAFHLSIRTGMLKLASFAVMIAALRTWSIVAPPTLGAMSSSSVMGGTRHA